MNIILGIAGVVFLIFAVLFIFRYIAGRNDNVSNSWNNFLNFVSGLCTAFLSRMRESGNTGKPVGQEVQKKVKKVEEKVDEVKKNHGKWSSF
jgi:hypothetical protein